MRKYRSGLIWSGLVVFGGIASAALWIAATGTFRLAWWWIAAGSVLIGIAADGAEKAITRRLNRRSRPRRAHARTTPNPRKDGVTP
jgi:hypothetical protein